MRVVPADPALRALQDLFPATGVPDPVRKAVKEAMGIDVESDQGELAYVRYHPTKDCRLLWAFPTPSGQPLLVSGKLFRDEEGAKTAACSSFQRLVKSVTASVGEVTCPYSYLPDRQLLLKVFPLDIRLPGLPLAASETWVRETFSRSLGLPQGEVRLAEAIPVSYKPWIRCVFRYALEGQNRRGQYFGKVFRDGRGEPMVSRFQALKAQLQASGAPWDIPAPLMYIPNVQMLVTEALEDGVEVKALLKRAADNACARATLKEHIARSAEGLAPFQEMVVDGLSCVTPQALLTKLEKKTESLHGVVPTLARAIEGRLRSLEHEARRLPPEPVGLAHGAFRHEHLLLGSEKLVLLDLDNLCLSGASADAGDFLAYLDWGALREPQLRPVIQECAEVFTQALHRHASVSAGWLAWYRAAAHVEWALRSFFSLSPTWPEMTEGLLQIAERTLATLAASKGRHWPC